MKYRREIDGLRALAVVPVILFHAGFKLFSGGFVGVDIFFVISGYLITSILLTDLSNQNFSILRFYERRARRILPALFLVLAVSTLVAWFLLIPGDMKDFAHSLAAVSVFASNHFFLHKSNYFDAAVELKPLLHTWSLAVEEQFYLFFPLFLMWGWRYGKARLILIIAVVATASLVLAQWCAFYKPELGFFILPTRAWELAIGSFAAFYFDKYQLATFSAKINQLFSLLGFSFIIVSIFLYDKNTPFPSVYALVPTLGTLFIILFAWPSTYVGRILGSRIFVGIGLISYSAYLWHQPLFAFARQRSLTEPSANVFTALSAVTIMLAYLTWRYVENPFRQKSSNPYFQRRAIFTYALTGGIAFLILGLTLDNTAAYESGLTPEQKHFLSFVTYSENETFRDAWREGKCFLTTRFNQFNLFDKEGCLSLSETKHNYLLLGDSHAAHLRYGLVANFPHINILQANASGCKLLLNAKGAPRCTDMAHYVLNEYLPRHKIDGVILSGRWEKADFDDLLKTVDYLKQFVDEVIVFGPTVEYIKPLPVILAQSKGAFAKGILKESQFLMAEKFTISSRLSEILKPTGVSYADMTSAICSEGVCRTMTAENEPMSFDYGHFTLSGSKTVVANLKPYLCQNVGLQKHFCESE